MIVPRSVITALHSKVKMEQSQPTGGQKDVAAAFNIINITQSFVTMCWPKSKKDTQVARVVTLQASFISFKN